MGIAIIPILAQLGQLAAGMIWPNARGQQIGDLIGRAGQLGGLNPKSFEFYQALIQLSAAGAGYAFSGERGIRIANLIGTLGEAGAMEIKDELARRGMTLDEVFAHSEAQFTANEADFARLDKQYREKLGIT